MKGMDGGGSVNQPLMIEPPKGVPVAMTDKYRHTSQQIFEERSQESYTWTILLRML